MTDTTLARTAPAIDDATLESLVLRGDMSGLTPRQRVEHYARLCRVLGLDVATQPLAYLSLSGKQVLYVTRGATDRLAAMHSLCREIIDGPKVIDLGGAKLVIAVCRATLPGGRYETATATVPLTDPANVLMKAETKAKRRATLAILGLGLLDESEVDTIPGAVRVEAEPVEDTPAESSRAMAAYVKAIEDADTLAAVRLARVALLEGLRAEGHDPAEWTSEADGYARRMVEALGWQASSADYAQLIGAEGHDLCVLLDSAAGLDPSALALWWEGHKAAVQQLHAAHRPVVWTMVARAAAGLVGPANATDTKRATAALRAAVEALAAPPAPAEAPFPRGEPGADDGDPEWYASPRTVRAYLDGKGTRREVENAVRKHTQNLHPDDARPFFLRAAVERLCAIDPAIVDAPALRQAVEGWATEGPRAKGGA